MTAQWFQSHQTTKRSVHLTRGGSVWHSRGAGSAEAIEGIPLPRCFDMLTCLLLTFVASRLSWIPLVGAITNRAQMLMFAGFVMLGWVLARRTIATRRRHKVDNRTANRELAKIRSAPQNTGAAASLSDAPPEIQRWQGAMFDLSRELGAELENRVATVQSLLHQVDGASAGIERPDPPAPPVSGVALVELIQSALARDCSIDDIAARAGIDPGEVRWTIAAMTPGAKVAG